MFKMLLNKPIITWAAASIVGILVFIFPFSQIGSLHSVFVAQLPGALLSIMGFVLAAAAIVVSVKNQGLLKVLADESPDLWNQLMAQFFITAKTSGVYALYLLLVSQLVIQTWQNIFIRTVYSLSMFGFTLMVLQTATAIYAMEAASRISSIPPKSEKKDLDLTIPDDISIATHRGTSENLP